MNNKEMCIMWQGLQMIHPQVLMWTVTIIDM